MLLLIALSALGFNGCHSGKTVVPSRVQAPFEVVDSADRVILRVGSGADDPVSPRVNSHELTLFSPTGKKSMTLTAEPNGDSRITLFRATGSEAVQLYATKLEEALAMKTPSGKYGSTLRSTGLDIFDKNGRPSVLLGDLAHRMVLEIYDHDRGTALLYSPNNAEDGGGASLSVSAPGGQSSHLSAGRRR